ncbi:MAG: hypothetical protein AB9866_17925 [Syntrophobacteraceae bacterium]
MEKGSSCVDFDQIQSDALTRNMDLTNVQVVVPCTFEVLEEAVKGFAGKEKQARELLLEYHHKYRNWHFVVQETQRYAIWQFAALSKQSL